MNTIEEYKQSCEKRFGNNNLPKKEKRKGGYYDFTKTRDIQFPANKLNFGCGKDIRKDYLNVDFRKEKGVDKIIDFNTFPYPFKDNTFDKIIVYHVLEHLENVPEMLKELHRISKSNAYIHIKVPYYNHPCAWVDCTHKRGFTRDTLQDFNINQPKNATYNNTYPKFHIEVVPNCTIIGKLIPTKFFKYCFSYIFGYIIKELEFKMWVVK